MLQMLGSNVDSSFTSSCKEQVHRNYSHDSSLLSGPGKRCCVDFFLLSLSLFIGVAYSKLHYDRSLCRMGY